MQYRHVDIVTIISIGEIGNKAYFFFVKSELDQVGEAARKEI